VKSGGLLKILEQNVAPAGKCSCTTSTPRTSHPRARKRRSRRPRCDHDHRGERDHLGLSPEEVM
jgi:hypothetical protein